MKYSLFTKLQNANVKTKAKIISFRKVNISVITFKAWLII